MDQGTATTLRSKGLAVAVHVALWFLLALVLLHMGGTPPHYRDINSYSLPSQNPAPVSRVDQLLSPSKWPTVVLDTNLPSPFFTTAFIPAPKPAPRPAPPPTTRKVTVVYQGYFATGNGPRTAMLKMPDGITTTPLGSAIVTNNYVAHLTHNTLTLTNAAGQTNLLLLNTAKELEIPIK